MTDWAFDVKHYGAVGDGVADDTAAVQAACKAARAASLLRGTTASARGAIVYFPRGQYRISESLQFDATYGIRLIGEGTMGNIGSQQSASLLFAQAAAENVDLISARSSDNFQIEHMDIQYEHANMLGTLVSVDGMYGVHLSYDTGTIDVQTGSSTVTLSGGTWQPTTPIMRLIFIAGYPYRITINSPTTGMLDTPYDGVTNNAASYKLTDGSDTANPVFRNVHLGGPANTGQAKTLLSLNMVNGALIETCKFDYAISGITGTRDGGWGTNVVTVSNSTFMRLSSGAGIRNPNGSWLVESCIFEPAYGYDNGPVGIILDDYGLAWVLNVSNCWFGDGGTNNLRPWIIFNGFTLNFINNFMSSAGENYPLITIAKNSTSTVHNVNISGNYFSINKNGPNLTPVVETGNSTIESMTLSGNFINPDAGMPVYDPSGRIQNLSIIDSGARTDFRTGFYEYGRPKKLGQVEEQVPLTSNDFGAFPGTWTVILDPLYTKFHYALTGRMMTIWFEFDSTDVSGDPQYLQLSLPSQRVFTSLPQTLSESAIDITYTPKFDIHTGTIECSDAGGPWVPATSFVVRAHGLRFSKLDGTTWATTDPTHKTSLRGAITIPVTWPNEPG